MTDIIYQFLKGLETIRRTCGDNYRPEVKRACMEFHKEHGVYFVSLWTKLPKKTRNWYIQLIKED